MKLKKRLKYGYRKLAPLWLQKLLYWDLKRHVQLISDSGRFDPEFYRILYPDFSKELADPITHYCLLGWRRGYDPSDDFDTSYYLDSNDDIRSAGINPFIHYISSGSKELRHPKPILANSFDDDVWFGRFKPSVRLVANYREPDWEKFHSDQQSQASLEAPQPHPDLGFYSSRTPDVLRQQSQMAIQHGISGFCFELATPISPDQASSWKVFQQTADIDLAFCLKVDCTASSRDTGFLNDILSALLDPRAICIMGRPILLLVFSQEACSGHWLTQLRSKLATALGLDPYLIGCLRFDVAASDVQALLDGFLDPGDELTPMSRAGYDFVPYKVVQASGLQSLRANQPAKPPRFHAISLGRHGQPAGSTRPLVYTNFTLADYRQWLEIALKNLPALPSRESPLLFLSSWNNWNEGQVLEPDKATGYARLNTTARTLLGISQETSLPKVSVIVPWNSDREVLRKTLHSISCQTYRNLEVVLIVKDVSLKSEVGDILQDYHASNSGYIIVFSDPDSASIPHWSRALAVAKGNLIWVVGPDANWKPQFLETLVAEFDDEAVLLAFGKIISSDSTHHVDQRFVRTAFQEVQQTLGFRFSIKSLNAAIFRRPESIPLLSDHQWLSMKYCGDWLFCLHIILGGKMAYAPNATITFFHLPSSIHDWDLYFREVSAVHKAVARHYPVSESWLDQARQLYANQYQQTAPHASQLSFEKLYNPAAVLDNRSQRIPNILVSTMGFYPGGAEILPIRLANEFKRHGLAVTLLSAGLHMRQHGVRRLLRSDIPVIETSSLEETAELIRDYGIEVLNSHQWHIQRYPNVSPNIFSRIAHVACLHGMIEHGNEQSVTRSELVKADQNVTTWIYTADKNLIPFENLNIISSSRARFLKLPNGMEPPRIEPVSREQLGIPADAFVLCCVSRAIPEKGWNEAIEVVRQSRSQTGRDIRLVLVGNGILYDTYRQEGVPDFVYLAGFSTNSVGHYAAADMGMMLTRFRSESFPLTIVDCLFAGKPYLATDVGDIRNMLTDGERIAGDVIPLDDWAIPLEKVVESLTQFILEPSHYARARELAKTLANRYRIDRVALQYIEIFKDDVAGISSLTANQ